MLAEQQTEWIINNILVNKGWHIDGDSKFKNVYFQKPPYPEQQKKLNGKRPDYILYQTGTNRPIAIIEAKKSGINLEPALYQASEYAKALNVPLVFAMNGSYCETRFVPNNKELILNGEEVRELIRETEALKFLEENTNEVYTLPKQVIVSRSELIKIFKELNDTLRGEGLRAGIERFSEFANILFLKLLSENEKESYWDFIKKLPDNRLITTINDSIIKEIENKYGGHVFTPVSMQNPKTLKKIIERIDPLVLSTIDTDIKGDAFEYFLKQTTSTNNDLGEYFTPRHIIKTMINLVSPKFKEKVYDPFCGTGGFLTESFNYIKENNIIENKEDLKRLRHETLYGGEITTTARIAKMNMILHGDGHSGVVQNNSLENPVDDKFDVIVSNIPFSQKTAEFSNLYYNGISKNNGDSVCVLHCLRALKKGGRMALVVPEGFLFRKDTAKVREFLLSKAKLQSIISLPSGSFLPYTGVKTDILYLTNAHQNNSQKSYWYFDVKNDGYSLDNHRKQIKGKNDLHKVAESDFKKVEKDESFKENILEIGFKTINLYKVKSNNWSLVGSQYLERVNIYKNPLIKLKQVCDILTGYAFKSKFFSELEGFPLIRIRDLSVGFTKTKYNCDDYDPKFIVNDGDILIGMDGEFNATLWNGGRALLNQRVALLTPKSGVLKDYLFHTIQKPLKDIENNTSFTTVKHISSKQILEIQIPDLSIEVQQKIIESIQKKEKEIQILKEKIEANKQSINKEINKIWQSKQEK